MKTCIKCGVEKPLEDFPKNPAQIDGLHSMCKSCKVKYEAIRRAKIRDFIKEAKKVCELCGETHPATLQFHHRDPNDKEVGIAELQARRWGLERIQAEIDKCRVLCANCHAKLHWETVYTLA